MHGCAEIRWTLCILLFELRLLWHKVGCNQFVGWLPSWMKYWHSILSGRYTPHCTSRHHTRNMLTTSTLTASVSREQHPSMEPRTMHQYKAYHSCSMSRDMIAYRRLGYTRLKYSFNYKWSTRGIWNMHVIVCCRIVMESWWIPPGYLFLHVLKGSFSYMSQKNFTSYCMNLQVGWLCEQQRHMSLEVLLLPLLPAAVVPQHWPRLQTNIEIQNSIPI